MEFNGSANAAQNGYNFLVWAKLNFIDVRHLTKLKKSIKDYMETSDFSGADIHFAEKMIEYIDLKILTLKRK